MIDQLLTKGKELGQKAALQLELMQREGKPPRTSQEGRRHHIHVIVYRMHLDGFICVVFSYGTVWSTRINNDVSSSFQDREG